MKMKEREERKTEIREGKRDYWMEKDEYKCSLRLSIYLQMQ